MSIRLITVDEHADFHVDVVCELLKTELLSKPKEFRRQLRLLGACPVKARKALQKLNIPIQVVHGQKVKLVKPSPELCVSADEAEEAGALVEQLQKLEESVEDVEAAEQVVQAEQLASADFFQLHQTQTKHHGRFPPPLADNSCREGVPQSAKRDDVRRYC